MRPLLCSLAILTISVAFLTEVPEARAAGELVVHPQSATSSRRRARVRQPDMQAAAPAEEGRIKIELLRPQSTLVHRYYVPGGRNDPYAEGEERPSPGKLPSRPPR
jgi:hypothetical protein